MGHNLTAQQMHHFDQNMAAIEVGVDSFVTVWQECAAQSCGPEHAVINFASHIHDQIEAAPLQEVVMLITSMTRRLAGDR